MLYVWYVSINVPGIEYLTFIDFTDNSVAQLIVVCGNSVYPNLGTS